MLRWKPLTPLRPAVLWFPESTGGDAPAAAAAPAAPGAELMSGNGEMCQPACKHGILSRYT